MRPPRTERGDTTPLGQLRNSARRSSTQERLQEKDHVENDRRSQASPVVPISMTQIAPSVCHGRYVILRKDLCESIRVALFFGAVVSI